MSKSTVYGSISKKIVASDLLDERGNCDFDREDNQAINKYIDTMGHYPEYKENCRLQEADPVLRNTHKFYEMSTQEMQTYQMKRLRRAYELQKDKWFINQHVSKLAWNYTLLGKMHGSLHQTMFVLCLENLATEEQAKKWVPLARSMRIMGAYAQTELSHGSDIQGLETTATLDMKTDEFIINTPTLTATKFWPGDLGLFSSHAIVFAKLIIDGNKYGVHPFLVQLRDTDTWKLLKGVKAGDLGPKFGYHSKNNGWCTFDQVRIPRVQMLMRYTKVDNEGCFSIEGDMRALYSSMMDIRMQLIGHSAEFLLRGLTIAIRYSVVRKQFKNNVDNPKTETKLLDYQTQQMKLLPLLALSMAFKFNFFDLWKRYFQFLDEIKQGKFDQMEEMHHLSSGFKALYTQRTMDSLLLIRQCIGGAGYSAWSGIPSIVSDFSSSVTYEGDNTVMAQQSFRFLQKMYKRVRKNKKIDDRYEYLQNIDYLLSLQCKANSAEEFTNIDLVDLALQVCTAATVQNTMDTVLMSKASQKEITNHLYALQIVEASLCHLKYITFMIFRKNINLLPDQNLRGHVTNLCSLVGLTFLQECMAAGYDSGYFKGGDRKLIQGAIAIMLKKIRPQAIPLIELADIPDTVLTSAIGNSYGDIYETHFEWAQKSRLNDQKDNIPLDFHKHLGPILKGKL